MFISQAASTLLHSLHQLFAQFERAALHINGSALYRGIEWYARHEPTRIPMSILVTLTPWLVSHMLRRPRYAQARDDVLYRAKTAASIALAIFQLQAFLVKPCDSVQARLLALEAFCLAILLPLEHIYSHRPSILFSLYLISTTGLQILLKWSSLALIVSEQEILQKPHVILTRLVMFVLHEQSKWHLLTVPTRAGIGQEDASGLWGRAFSTSMYTVLWNDLTEDLFSNDGGYTSPTLLTDRSMPDFNNAWNKYRNTAHGLLKACLAVCHGQMIRAAIAKLAFSILVLSSSLYFANLVSVLEQRSPFDNHSPSTKFDFIVGAIILFVTIEFFRQYSIREANRAKTTARGMLIASILQKVPLLSDEFALKSSNLSLLTETITSAVNNLDIFHMIAVELLKLLFSARLLWRDMGPLILVVLIAISACNYLCYQYTDYFKVNNDIGRARNTRTTATSSLLRNLHSLRMMGRLEIYGEQIAHLHKEEMNALGAERFFWAKQMAILTMVHGSVVVLAFYTKNMPASCGSYAPILKCLYVLLNNELSSSRIAIMARQIDPSLAAFSTISDFLNLPTNKPILPLRETTRDTRSQPTNIVQFRRANVAVESRGVSVLRNIDFNASQHCVTLVVGEPGTGKSVLLKTILGRTEVQSGSVHVLDTAIAYCSQNTWLHSRSIKDNIVGTGRFDQRWYEKVKAKCFISEDIRRLPNKDDFLVSHEQTILGGALRQRLVLARAVYLRANLTLLDDFLSAQDEQMAVDLVKSLFGRRKGILRKSSVIIATSEPALLIDATHCIFKINRQGYILETTKRKAMQDYEAANGLVHPTDQARQQHAELLNVDAMARQLLRQVQQIKPIHHSYQTATISSLFSALGWQMIGVGSCLNLIGVVVENIAVVYLAIWLFQSSATSHPIPLHIFSAICAFTTPMSKGIVTSNCYKYLSTELHRNLLDTVLRMPVYAWTSNTVDIIQSLFNDSLDATITLVLPDVLYVSIYFCFTAILIVGLCFFLTPWLILIYPFTVFTILQLQKFVVRATRQLKQFDYKSSQALRLHYIETLAGAPHIYAQGWYSNYRLWEQPHVDGVQRTFYLGLCIERWRTSILSLHAIVLAVFIVIISLSTDMSPATCTFLCFNYPNLVLMLEMFLSRYIKLDDSLAAVQRVRSFIETAPQEPGEQGMIIPPEEWPSKGIVKMENASIWLDPKAPAPVLSNISYTLKRQAKTGLFGRPRSGKSTLLYALLNMVKYTGSIKIDGIEVRTVSQEVLRQRIAILPERPALIIGTIAQNLLPLELHDEEDPKLANVLENILSSLGMLALVRERGGLDAEIADFKFSPDQLQRFALAQTLTSYYYYRQKLMIEDGVCNSVDATTLKYLRRVIKDIFGQGSMIVTGQNLSVVKGANKIGLVEDGQVWFEP